MRLKFLIVMFLFIFINSASAAIRFPTSFPNEPDGIDGMKLGATIDELKKQGYNLQYYQDYPELKHVGYLYIRKDPQIYGVPYDQCFCEFYHNRLIMIVFKISANDNDVDFLKKSVTLYKSIEKIYGPPHHLGVLNSSSDTWSENSSNIGVYPYTDFTVTWKGKKSAVNMFTVSHINKSHFNVSHFTISIPNDPVDW